MKIFKDGLLLLILFAAITLVIYLIEGDRFKMSNIFPGEKSTSIEEVSLKTDSVLDIADQKIQEVNDLRNSSITKIDSLQKRINQKNYTNKAELLLLKNQIQELNQLNTRNVEKMEVRKMVVEKVMKFDTIHMYVYIVDTIRTQYVKNDTNIIRYFKKGNFGKIKKADIDSTKK